MVGKWHVAHVKFTGKPQLNYENSDPFWTEKSGWPLQRGFEEFFGTIHGVGSFFDPFSLTRGNTPIKPEQKDFYYMVRAVSPGTYKLGPVQADAMYDGSYHSYNGACTIRISE